MLDIAAVMASDALQRPMKMSEAAAASTQIAGFFYDYYPAICRFLPSVAVPQVKVRPNSIVNSGEFLSEYTIVMHRKPDAVRVSGVYRQICRDAPYSSEYPYDTSHSLGVFPSALVAAAVVASIPARIPAVFYYGKRRERMQCCVPSRWQSLLRDKPRGVSIKVFCGFLLHALEYSPQVVHDADVICGIAQAANRQLHIDEVLPLVGYRLSAAQVRAAVACIRDLKTFYPKLY